MTAADLYEEDFYLWTQAQAEALRAEAARRPRSNSVDWEHVIEEVEDLGKNYRNKCRSWALRIIQHLYYLAWTGRTEPREGWRQEIRAFRADMDLWITTAIRNSIETELEELHVKASKLAADHFQAEEPSALLDRSLRWTLAQILGETEDPLARK